MSRLGARTEKTPIPFLPGVVPNFIQGDAYFWALRKTKHMPEGQEKDNAVEMLYWERLPVLQAQAVRYQSRPRKAPNRQPKRQARLIEGSAPSRVTHMGVRHNYWD